MYYIIGLFNMFQQVRTKKNLEQFQLLQINSYFESLLDTFKYPYQRKFPIDNEDYET